MSGLVVILLLAWMLCTRSGRAAIGSLLVIVGLLIFVVMVSGCQVTPVRPPPSFVCSDPTDPKLCSVEKRLFDIEAEIAANKNERESREFMRDARDQARRTCEFAHGAGSILCN